MTTREKEKEGLDCELAKEIQVIGARRTRKASPNYKLSKEIQAMESRKTRLAWGGVSPERGVSAAHNCETLAIPPGKPSTIGTFPDFTYHGGPVITHPRIYVSFWGALWLSDQKYKARAQRLTQFHQDLLKSDFMNVLSQYGVGTGSGSGVFVQSLFVTNTPTTLNEPLVQGVIQSCINASTIPEPPNPSNNILMVYLDETIGMKDLANDLVLCEPQKDSAFGYHSFFHTEAGNPFYYGIIPAMTDAQLRETCPSGDRRGLQHLSAQPEQRQTQVASHVFAEMTTNPELSAWFDPKYGENGDICNGEPDVITVGANQWILQRIYSKFDDIQTQGASYRLSQASSPKLLLSPGPVAPSAMMASIQQIPAYDCLLPFPSVHINNANAETTLNAQELRDYVMDVFHPLRAEHMVADLPRMLREVLAILEMEEESFLDTQHGGSEPALAAREQPLEASLQQLDLPRMLREVAAILEMEEEPPLLDTQHDDVQHDDHDDGTQHGRSEPVLAKQEQQNTPQEMTTAISPAAPVRASAATDATIPPPFASGSRIRRSNRFDEFKWLPIAVLLLVVLFFGTIMAIVQIRRLPSIRASERIQVKHSAPMPATLPADDVITIQQLDRIGWTKAGLSQSDAVEAQRIATTFVEREMSYDYRDIGTPTHHSGTFTAATFLLTSGAQDRFQQNDVRVINNALYDKVSTEKIIQQVVHAQTKLVQFQVVPGQRHPNQFAWFVVSFANFQSHLDHAAGKRIEGNELDPTSQQPRTYQMMVVLMRVSPEMQIALEPLGKMNWLVNTYGLDATKPLAIGTVPTL